MHFYHGRVVVSVWFLTLDFHPPRKRGNNANSTSNRWLFNFVPRVPVTRSTGQRVTRMLRTLGLFLAILPGHCKAWRALPQAATWFEGSTAIRPGSITLRPAWRYVKMLQKVTTWWCTSQIEATTCTPRAFPWAFEICLNPPHARAKQPFKCIFPETLFNCQVCRQV